MKILFCIIFLFISNQTMSSSVQDGDVYYCTINNWVQIENANKLIQWNSEGEKFTLKILNDDSNIWDDYYSTTAKLKWGEGYGRYFGLAGTIPGFFVNNSFQGANYHEIVSLGSDGSFVYTNNLVGSAYSTIITALCSDF